ncbi:MAG: hypothetical protein K8R58_05135 [Bacteroidales bacterium]|nr:hypothetical protein [Bacteroidales bacterium]
MKKLSLLSLVIAFFLFTGTINAQNTCISDVAHTADASAVLDVYSTSLGMLVPRLSSAPTTPANGLLYYSTSSNSFFYNAGTSGTPSWAELSYGSLWSRSGTDTYLSNMGDNVVIGTNTSAPGYKFYVYGATSQMSRFDGQVEFWNVAGGVMDADINDDGLGNGVFSLYDAGNTAQVRLQSAGNSYLNGGWIGIGTTIPLTNIHLFDNFANPMPQFLIDQPGAGNASVGYGIPGRIYSVGLVQDIQGLMNDNYKICDGPTLTPPLNYFDLSTMMEIHNENTQPGIIDFNHQSRSRAWLSTMQNVGTGSWVPINFDTDATAFNMGQNFSGYDEHNEFTTGAPAFFTATEDGFYQVNSRTEFDLHDFQDPPVGMPVYVSIAIYVNRGMGWVPYAEGNNLQISGNTMPGDQFILQMNNAPNVSDVVYLNATDRLQIRVFQNTGIGISLVPNWEKTYVSIHKSS